MCQGEKSKSLEFLKDLFNNHLQKYQKKIIKGKDNQFTRPNNVFAMVQINNVTKLTLSLPDKEEKATHVVKQHGGRSH